MAVRLRDGSVLGVNDTFSGRLKAVREEAGLSQGKMAEAINVSVAAYRNYEWGHREPSLLALQSIIVTFDLDAEWLLFGDAERSTFQKSRG